LIFQAIASKPDF